MESASLTLVIPVYNGASFLARTLATAREWLAAQHRRTELLVVDDGSTDATWAVLAEFGARHGGKDQPRFTPLRHQHNRGKGASVRRGWLLAAGDLVLFTDADLTYPVENLALLVEALEGGADVVYGNRMHRDSRYVVAPSFFGKLFTRHAMGRAFNLLARTLVIPGVDDTQAGLKGVRKAAGELLAGRLLLDRFSFDLELLFVARRLGLQLADRPVLFHYRKEPSTVRFVRDSLQMLRDMLAIRWRGWRGVYDQPRSPEGLAELLRGDQAAPGGGSTAGSRAMGRIG